MFYVPSTIFAPRVHAALTSCSQNKMQKEMLCDSVQNMEYTITTPLMSAVLVAAMSPTIPTGMVQWVLVCLLASHLLCIPVVYLSHMCSKYASQQDGTFRFHNTAMKLGIAMLLAVCIILQTFAFMIKLGYITSSLDYYGSQGILRDSVWFMFAMQMVFIVTVVFVALSAIMRGYGATDAVGASMAYLADRSSFAYMAINLMIKLVIGCMLASSAMNQHFPVFSCDVWEGRHASPDVPPVSSA